LVTQQQHQRLMGWAVQVDLSAGFRHPQFDTVGGQRCGNLG
jgi:hypothetical protein